MSLLETLLDMVMTMTPPCVPWRKAISMPAPRPASSPVFLENGLTSQSSRDDGLRARPLCTRVAIKHLQQTQGCRFRETTGRQSLQGKFQFILIVAVYIVSNRLQNIVPTESRLRVLTALDQRVLQGMTIPPVHLRLSASIALAPLGRMALTLLPADTVSCHPLLGMPKCPSKVA